MLDPFRYIRNDLADVISECYENDYETNDFLLDERRSVPIQEIICMALPAYVPFIKPESLANRKPEEIFNILKDIKGEEFSKRALVWLAEGFPAVVFFNMSRPKSRKPLYMLCDGHKRLALANAIGIKTLDLVIAQRKT